MARGTTLVALTGVAILVACAAADAAFAQARPRRPVPPSAEPAAPAQPQAPPALPAGTPPPPQPDKGPGGAEYPIATADVVKEAYGLGGQQVFVFRPGRGFEGPRPVVVFGHAFNAFNPKIYGAWIDHLARRGSIVMFPRYQNDERATKGDKGEVIPNAAAGVKLAFEKLGAAADLTRVAYVGHAAGGNIVANLAAMPDLPKARLLFAVAPGNSWGNRYQAIPLTTLDKLPEDMLLISMTGDTDTVAKDTDARKMIRDSQQILPARKMLVKAPTDTHGSPPLFATHYSPMGRNDAYELESIPVIAVPEPPPQPAPAARSGRARPAAAGPRTPPPARIPQPEEFGGAPVDALDFFAYWKTLDIAMPVAFAGEDTTPIKRHPELSLMGQWSDGWPVRRLSFESAREPAPPKPEAAPEPAPTRPRR
jgi:hypothetical protein